jgi:hypothetical protein
MSRHQYTCGDGFGKASNKRFHWKSSGVVFAFGAMGRETESRQGMCSFNQGDQIAPIFLLLGACFLLTVIFRKLQKQPKFLAAFFSGNNYVPI